MVEHSISVKEIQEKTPFQLAGTGRAIPQALFYNPDFQRDGLPDYVAEQDWHLFIPGPDGELTLMRGGESIKSTYFGVEAASDEDIQLPFLSFYYQHASFPNVMEYFSSVQEDIHHLAACISKIGIYQYISEGNEFAVADYVQTEFEYIFSVCRSLFDSLYMIAKSSWSNVRLNDGGKEELPSKLSKMVLNRYEPVSAEELESKYGIRTPFAEYFEDLATFLSDVKYYRDSIHHFGGSFDTIFRLDEGLAVDSASEPYSEFDAWEDSQIGENSLAPVWPFISYIIGGTIQFMNRLPNAVFDKIRVPPELAPDYEVYIRGPDIQNLSLLNSLAGDGMWGEPVNDRIQSRMDS